MKQFKKHWKISVLLFIGLFDVFVWYAVAAESPTDKLTIAFLNVGQGDAIYIESPTKQRIMIDGGPSSAVLGELRTVAPFYLRSFDTLVVTNPDADHYSGFIDMLSAYKINRIIEPGTHSTTERYKEFETQIQNKNIEKTIAKRGMVLDIGGGAVLHILYPDKDVSNDSTNDGSIVAELVYGETEIMLTGDTTKKSEAYVLALDGSKLDSEILKVAHHGSKTSSDEDFVKAVQPEFAVISAGKNNRYGHPSKETTNLFSKLGIQTLGTYTEGTIVFTSDGKIVKKQ
jgi:competence protein ComEC